MTIAAIDAVAALPNLDLSSASPLALRATSSSFAQMLLQGVDGVNQKVTHADAMVKAFAVDDTVPLHQVTFALEQARLSVELMMQVRARLVEGYQEVLRMQL